MRSIFLGSFVLVLIMNTGIVSAQVDMGTLVAAYRHVIQVPGMNIVVPTVVELPIMSLPNERREFLVVENTSGNIIPSYLRESYTTLPAPLSALIYINGAATFDRTIIDKKRETGLTFHLPESGQGSAEIVLTTPTPILSSALTFDFGQNVTIPTAVEIRTMVNGQEYLVLSETKMTSEQVLFIPTVASTWTIRLTYAQPLIMNEINLLQDDAERSVTRGLRFLAQPQTSYTVYHNPDRMVSVPYIEQGDLQSDRGVVSIATSPSLFNTRYVPADVDQDGVQDMYDNCVTIANPTQVDVNYNGSGDECEDFDRDGYMNNLDNCRDFPNGNQRDEDGDGMGDVCDGEESRLTERLPWVPWAGMGIAGLVLIGLFAVVAMRPMKSVAQIPEDDMHMPPPSA